MTVFKTTEFRYNNKKYEPYSVEYEFADALKRSVREECDRDKGELEKLEEKINIMLDVLAKLAEKVLSRSQQLELLNSIGYHHKPKWEE